MWEVLLEVLVPLHLDYLTQLFDFFLLLKQGVGQVLCELFAGSNRSAIIFQLCYQVFKLFVKVEHRVVSS